MKERTGAAIDRSSGSARNAVIFFALAIVFRCLGLVNRPELLEMTGRYVLFTEMILPVLFCVLTIFCIVFFGRKHLVMTLLPMVVCLLFFIARSISEDNIMNVQPSRAESLVRITVYIVLSSLYSCTVQTEYRMKWLLIPAFLLGIAWHLVFEDYPALVLQETSPSFQGIMMELAVLFILVALVFMTFSFRRKEVADTNKDKITEESEELERTEETGTESGTGSGTIERQEQQKEQEYEEQIKQEGQETQEEEQEGQKEQQKEKKKSSKFFRFLRRGDKEPESDAQNEETKEEPSEELTEKSDGETFSEMSAAAVTEPDHGQQEIPAETAKEKVLDESFFDKPYRVTLTLDPPAGTDETGKTGV